MITIVMIVAAGALLGAGLTVIITALMPHRPAMQAAITNVSATSIETPVVVDDWKQSIGLWARQKTSSLPAIVTVSARDLAALGLSPIELYFQKTVLALVLLMLPLVLGIGLQLLFGLPFVFPALLSIGLAVLGWVLPDLDAREKASKARDEYARAAAVYLELVATEMRRAVGAAAALEDAALVSDSWVFTRIRQRLAAARLEGVQPWDALNAFGKEIDVPELAEVGDHVRLAGERGAIIYESLMARGRALRLQMLNQLQEAENKRSESFDAPVALSAIVFIAMLITPVLLNLLTNNL